ncbi:hypothetical protein LTR01_006424 [Friedmanniomyces endolithicus]|nr:hypothetical protein LTR01_006424 [Friedmanniomyces endolithicus]KAK0828214.1 hypothetical protein LTR73_005167 [Friedmanniomyces endolithicus]
MSSYLSSLLTSTTSRYNTLRRTLLSNEDDGDTEDDSHISRVLRAYYTEKARPYPPWLPPDPNDRRAITPQPYPAAGVGGQGQQQGGGGYFPTARGQPQYAAAQNAGGQRGSLSDLWDPPSSSAQTPPPQQPQSLRAGVRRRLQPSSRPSSALAPPPVQARPLPSQRAGSHQNVGAQGGQYVPPGPGMGGYAPQPQGPRGMGMGVGAEQSPPGSSSGGGGGGGGGTAQDRLKARLWGGQRTGSSTSVGSGVSGGGGAGAAANPYGTSANAPWSSNGGDAYGGYDTGGARNPYDTGEASGSARGGQGANNRRYGRAG